MESGKPDGEAVRDAAGLEANNDDEQMRQSRIARRPEIPTKADVEAHNALHIDYQSW